MEREVVVLKKALIFILAITFISTVFCYGTGKRFSLELYYTNIAEKFSEIPSIQGLVDIWKKENTLSIALMSAGEEYDIATYSDSGDEERTGFFDKVKAALSSIGDMIAAIGDFIVKVWDSIIYVMNILISVFSVLPCLLPWNAVVAV